MRRRWKRPEETYPDQRPYSSAPSGRRRQPVPDTIRHHFFIPLAVLQATNRAMKACRLQQRECYVWWGGYFTGEGEAQIVAALWPQTTTEFGRVHLGHQDLTAMHNKLRDLDQVLVAELHTHPPGAGGQNEVDAANPAAAYPGFISIVVPDFAAPLFYDLRKTYVYEYQGHGSWRELDALETSSRFLVEEPYHEVRVQP